MSPSAALLPDGKRLHLHHGPIDLIIGADGDRDAAFAAATGRFEHILEELVTELRTLRSPVHTASRPPQGTVAQRMFQAAYPFHDDGFVTCMAAVAGSVADEILQVMCENAHLERAYVNNGGDIALHLTPGTRFRMAMAGHDGRDLGRIDISASDPVRGIATSGRHGRSLSRGIADSVTTLGRSAAQADVTATLIANHVDLPGHPAIARKPARDIDDDSDLGDLTVVTRCDALPAQDVGTALDAGLTAATEFIARDLTVAAALFLENQTRATGFQNFQISQRTPEYA